MDRAAQRAEIVALKKLGWTHQAVADRVGVCKRTVARWWDRYRDDAMAGEDWRKDRPRAGRPRVTTPEVDAQIVATVRANPITNASNVRQTLNLPISLDTVRRRLFDTG